MWLANFALSQSFLVLSQNKAQVLLIYAVCAFISFVFVMIRESKELKELQKSKSLLKLLLFTKIIYLFALPF
nr:hypothetical protein [uncultured Campylobacter sp.]